MKPPTMNLNIEVEKLLADAIELADIGGITVTARSIAECLYDSEPQLMAELHRPWIVDRLMWIIGRKRRSQWRRNPSPQAQLVLPGFEGLPQTIFLRNGSRKLLDEAKTTDVREHIKMLKARLKTSPKIQRMERVLDLMQKYAAEEPGIKWAEVKRREIEGQN